VAIIDLDRPTALLHASGWSGTCRLQTAKRGAVWALIGKGAWVSAAPHLTTHPLSN
jgi:hypothetical protein